MSQFLVFEIRGFVYTICFEIFENKLIEKVEIAVSLFEAMAADGDLYEIKKFPVVYYYMILKFAADILFLFKADELKANEKSEKEFKNACYLWFNSHNQCINQRLLKFIASEVLTLQNTFNLPIYQEEVCWKLWENERVKNYFKLIARLEFYGTVCQSPQLLKANSRGEIDLSFISVWARNVLKRGYWIRHGENFTIQWIYGEFFLEKRDFVGPRAVRTEPFVLKRKRNGHFLIKKKK